MAEVCYGIDIGAATTKLVAIDRRKTVLVAKSIPTPWVESGATATLDFPEFVKRLADAVPMKGLQTGQLATSMQSHVLTAIVVTLPKMPAKDLAAAAAFEAKRRMIPPPGPDAVFEVSTLGEKKVGQASQLEVLVIKADKPEVDNAARAMTQLELKPALIVPSSLALLDAVSEEDRRRESLAIVNMGASSLDVIIARQGAQRFLRSTRFGYQPFLAELAKGLLLPPAEAEKLFLASGILKPQAASETPEMTQDVGVATKVQEIAKPLVERIITEIRRSLIFYREESGQRVETILLTGGSMLIPDLIPYLAQQIGGDLRLLDPFQDLHLKKPLLDEVAPQATCYATACGLAKILCDPKRKRRAVNFIPAEIRRAQQRSFRALVIVQLSFVLIFGVIWAWLATQQEGETLKGKVAGRRAEFDVLQPYFTQAQDLSQKKQRLQAHVDLLEGFKRSSPNAPTLLQQVARVIPQGSTVTELSLVRKTSSSGTDAQTTTSTTSAESQGAWTLQLKVEAIESYEQAAEIAEQLKANLERLASLTEVKLDFPNAGKLKPKTLAGGQVELSTRKTISFSASAKVR